MKVGTPGFTGERLKAAREARGIATATSFAEMIGVTRAAVSQYELGVQTPSPEVMRIISQRLNLPIQHFLLPPPAPSGTLFFRSMASATKSDRIRIGRQFQWLRDITDTVSNYVRVPNVDIPEADVPDNPIRITDEHIEQAATNLRRHWKLGNGPISDLNLLLENKGVILASIDVETDRIDAFSNWCDQRRRAYVILARAKRFAARTRANAAHELGHMVLHRNLKETDLRRPALFKEIERQAFRFAGAFLLPEPTFLRELYSVSLGALQELKPRWKVAMAFMLKRAEDLGAVNETHARRLWINLARRGWKRREPLDDHLQPEYPRFLKRCIEMIVQKGRVGRDELPLLINLPASDIERLTGLPSGWFTQPNGKEELREVDPVIIKLPRQDR
jgi:Zn-dependent peptidase ImmA (M78 family)/DNA-binding XRE family transcriptional regulator